MTPDDQSHLRLAAEQHMREAGKLLIAFLEADVTKLDELTELERHAIGFANHVALRRFEGRLRQRLREEAEQQRQQRKVRPYPVMNALGDW